MRIDEDASRVKSMKVGFVGLGEQGRAMAQMIERAGWPLFIWARRPASVEPFRGTSATVVPTLSDLAAATSVVCLCVNTDDDVRSVVLGLEPGLVNGSVVVVHSTVLPSTCVELASALVPRGVSLIDAPVTGGSRGALARTLQVLVGGEQAVFERVLPIFASYGRALHLGPLGSGQQMKLLNNALLMANLLHVDSALDVASRLGFDRDRAREALSSGSGSSAAIGTHARFEASADLEGSRRNLTKDLSHFRAITQGIASAEPLVQRGTDLLSGELISRHAST